MTLFDNQFDKLYVFLMRVILSTVWVVLLILIVSLTGCTSIPGENDLKDDQMIMSSMLFTPKSATRLEEKDVTAELDEKAIKVGEKKPSDTRDNGVYAFMNTETNYSLRKPNLENARKCSLSAGLPISNFEFDKAREAYQNSLELNPNSQKVEKALSRLETLWPDSQ